MSVNRNRILISFVIVILLFPLLPLFPIPVSNAASLGHIDSLYTDKSRYNPGDIVTITATIENESISSWTGSIALDINHLAESIYSTSQAVTIAANSTQTINFYWTSSSTDFKGYMAIVDAAVFGVDATAIDVSSDISKYPRYGYMSEFKVDETKSESIDKVNELARDYKINAWQFYDWMWRHETMISRSGTSINPTWIDLFNREISWETVQNQIDAVHSVNGSAMAYAMIYAAREDYNNFGVSPTWGLFQDPLHTSQLNVDFGNNSTYMYLFNPANTGWQSFIFDQYIDSINTANFDGIHVDQMGQRNGIYDYSGNPVDLSLQFTPFLNAAKSALTTNDSTKNIITYNIVDGTTNGWAANDISANANVDFLYSEIWHLSDSYQQLNEYINQLKANSNNKAVVLAAYMNYKENIGDLFEAEEASLHNVAIDSDHANYTGTGFVDQFAEIGDAVTFTINATEERYYSLVFRFANSSGNTATRNLYVDNAFEFTLPFSNQSSWDEWSEDSWHQVYLTPGTHTIKLAYEAGNSEAINLDSLTLGTFDDHSIRLADAMMSASGATHIELGEDNQMLAHEYYPNRSKSMRNSLKSALSSHYNFITAYENLLFDDDVINQDNGNQFLELTGKNTSGDGQANTIWQMNKRTDDYNIIHLINLYNNDNLWRNSANMPTFHQNINTKTYIGENETISAVYAASPDYNSGITQSLSFTTGYDSKGKYVSFIVPELQYWTMIYMDRTFTTPTSDTYEAEQAIKSNVTINTNHSGYTGSGFVDSFASENDGISFVVAADTEDDYVLRIRYSNGGSTATRDVYANGQYIGRLSLPNTGGWDQWSYSELTTKLKAGLHSIVIWYNSTDTGAINADHLTLNKTYIWQFDRKITIVPAGYRITFRTGSPGWIHWGVNGWTSTVDTQMRNNGSSNDSLDYEFSIDPFTTGTNIDFTFLWDDDDNGIIDYSLDRWEGVDFNIEIN